MRENYKIGDIYWVNLSGQGHVQNGWHPGIIVQCDAGNKYSETTVVVPITSKNKTKLPTHVKIYKNNYPLLKKDSLILLEQIVTIDKCRLRDKVCHLNISDLNDVDMAIRVSLDVK